MKRWLLIFLLLVSCNSGPKFHDLAGNAYRLKDFNGKWLIINYWAKWCYSCMVEVKELNAVHRQSQELKLLVMGINYDELDSEQMQKQVQSLGIEYPILREDLGKQFGRKELQGLPTTLIIDPHGKLVATLLGGQTQQQVVNAISKLAAAQDHGRG